MNFWVEDVAMDQIWGEFGKEESDYLLEGRTKLFVIYLFPPKVNHVVLRG